MTLVTQPVSQASNQLSIQTIRTISRHKNLEVVLLVHLLSGKCFILVMWVMFLKIRQLKPVHLIHLVIFSMFYWNSAFFLFKWFAPLDIIVDLNQLQRQKNSVNKVVAFPEWTLSTNFLNWQKWLFCHWSCLAIGMQTMLTFVWNKLKWT